MKNYQQKNNLIGWLTFTIAAIIYLLTVEPTLSWWDCGEFLSSAAKLQVGHPPGAPFYMIVARIFALLAPDSSQVALFINCFSALVSAATIMFLFWTITHLARMVCFNPERLTKSEQTLVLGSGLVGALAYAFSDTFWFSAVEAEVYAFSSLFTAVVFWAILKWENEADSPRANRWLLFIAYLMGLSIGVHLLNLLAIPAIVFIVYFKKYQTSTKGILITFLLACLIIATIQFGIIPGLPKLAGWFELLFVNGMGLPFNSGLFFYLLLLVGVITGGVIYTHKKGKVLLNTIILCASLIILGYSSYALIMIRSSANPPMDENNPENVFSLIKYLNREQYGDVPLLYGKYYSAPVVGEEPGKTEWIKGEDRYIKAKQYPKSIYDDNFNTFFPRMHSPQSNHVQAYKNWGGEGGKTVRIRGYDGEMQSIKVPGFLQNIRFFANYQLGHMYLRYFMWNFAGRQNDVQGHGGPMHGNWISGIPFIDNLRLGPQDKLPIELAQNKARNRYFLLPLLLGLIGFIFHYSQGKRGKQDWWVVSLLFFFTGIAIVIYLNQTPYQPRERDYAYAGSFYAFAIWIGLGTMALCNRLERYLGKRYAPWIVTFVSLIAVPGIMIAQNWDDHDRSGRYMARDSAVNYLESCAPNAILFTFGDNDTFPLWYAQEVEGIRTDIRVCNLSLLNMDWYITQMKKQAYQSESLPISLGENQYRMGTRDILPVYPKIDRYIRIKDAVDFIASDDPRKMVTLQGGEKVNFLPSNKLYIPAGADSVFFNVKAQHLTKSDIIVLDIIANNNWERPVYFDLSAQKTLSLNLDNHLRHEGLAYRLIPETHPSTRYETGSIDTEILYKNLMEKFTWGNIQDTTIWVDTHNQMEVQIMEYKNTFTRLALKLLEKGDTSKAVKVLDRCQEIFPAANIPSNYDDFGIAEAYYVAGEYEKANSIIQRLARYTFDRIDYYVTIPTRFVNGTERERERQMAILSNCIQIAREYNQVALSKELDKKLRDLINQYSTEN